MPEDKTAQSTTPNATVKSQTTNEVDPKRKHRLLLLLIVLIVSLLLIAAAATLGYWFGKSGTGKETINYTTSTESSSSSEISESSETRSSTSTESSSSQAADPTANWETYTIAEYGIKFKHPANVQVKKSDQGYYYSYMGGDTSLVTFYPPSYTPIYIENGSKALQSSTTIEPLTILGNEVTGKEYLYGEESPVSANCTDEAKYYSYYFKTSVIAVDYNNDYYSGCDSNGNQVSPTRTDQATLELSRQIIESIERI